MPFAAAMTLYGPTKPAPIEVTEPGVVAEDANRTAPADVATVSVFDHD